MIGEKVIKTLELHKILLRVAEYAHGMSAKKCIAETKPAGDFSAARQKLTETDEADRVLYMHLKSPISDYDEVDESIKKAEVGSTLSIKELLGIKRLLRCARICKHAIEEIERDELPLLRAAAAKIALDKKLEDDIETAVLNEEELSDNASAELKTIRRSIARCNTDIKDTLTDITKSDGYKKYLQESIVTMRAGRYVVPVKAEYRQQVTGLVHDRSQTGSTFFIEPMQVVELNNRLKSLELDELAEIERILKAFTARVQIDALLLKTDFSQLFELDVIFARAAYSKGIRGVLPEFSESGEVDIRRGRHPLIDSKTVVPIDVRIGSDFDILVITGPNTGGKTVSLKTVGLFSLMSMCGIFIPAEPGSKISFFEDVFSDIGDEQSIESSLSTFSSHILNIKGICENVGKNSLVLLDEIGAGTDPDEGAALAISIVDYIAKKGAKLITTTHYDKLKEYSASLERSANASMDFDSVTLAPTYRLRIGVTGSSKAFEIAALLGLSGEIIERAKTMMSPQKLQAQKILSDAEKLIEENGKRLAETERLRAEAAEQLKSVKAQRQLLEERLERAKLSALKEAKAQLAEDISEAAELLSELKETAKRQQVGTADIVKAGQIKGDLDRRLLRMNNQSEKKGDAPQTFSFCAELAKEGDRVFVKSLNLAGIIERANVSRGEYSVKVGSMSVKVKAADLLGIAPIKEDKKDVAVVKRDTVKAVKNEIKLLGQTAYDAEILVGEFLEEASAAGLKEVKIIHGMGTGRLRAAVQDILRASSLVEEFRLGRYGEGDRGVTIVTLK